MKRLLLPAALCFLLSGCERKKVSFEIGPFSTGGGVAEGKALGIDFRVEGATGTEITSEADIKPGDHASSSVEAEITFADDAKVNLDSADGGANVAFRFNGADCGTLKRGDNVVIDKARNITVNGIKRDSGMALQPADPAPLAEVAALPKDFALEYTTRTVGVDPPEAEFIRIQPNKGGGRLLTSGRIEYEGGTATFLVTKSIVQTEERCLKLYNKARSVGFFGLKDNYEEVEFGGVEETLKITADGAAKTVCVYGAQVKPFELVVAAILDLNT